MEFCFPDTTWDLVFGKLGGPQRLSKRRRRQATGVSGVCRQTGGLSQGQGWGQSGARCAHHAGTGGGEGAWGLGRERAEGSEHSFLTLASGQDLKEQVGAPAPGPYLYCRDRYQWSSPVLPPSLYCRITWELIKTYRRPGPTQLTQLQLVRVGPGHLDFLNAPKGTLRYSLG